MAAEDPIVRALLAELGEDVVIAGERLGERRWADWSGVPAAAPKALLRPRDTQQVARALAICNRSGQSVVVQGGLTGLAGGACTRASDIALSLERMNRIEETDTVSGTMTVQAGAVLQHVQESALQAGMMFPLDLGARGSCTIGGTLACNAGGNRVLKYGMMRDQVLGLEAVLADGSVIGAMHKMLKNNTGFDLKNLLIGSEGTLGIVTRAVLRLRPRPECVATAWCGLPDYASVTRLLHQAQQKLPGGVSAFEVMWPSYCDYVLANVRGLRAPLPSRHAFYVLMESVGADASTHQAGFDHLLETMLEAGVIENAAIAHSERDAQAFWAMRDAPAEFPILMPRLVAFDVSFSIADIGAAAQDCHARLRARWPDSTVLVYGHLGDGNLHLIVNVPGADDATISDVESAVYGLVHDYAGSVSAEHGIGAKKRNVLHRTRSPADLNAMRAIKHALDPKGILNPGKVLPEA